MDIRYSRQVLFPEIGKDGQEKLLDSRVVIVGCGALGASHAEMMTRAGVGYIRLVDRDFVEYSNLQRQTLYGESDAAEGLPKAAAAKTRLSQINSSTEIEEHVADVNRSNIEQLIDGVDLILDGTDNFQVRYLVNDASVKKSVPWIYGAAVSSYGTTMTIIPGETPCLRCVFEEIPAAGSSPTCDTAGVVQPIISTISSIQVTEAFKLLIGKPDQLHKSLIQADIWHNDWRKIALSTPNRDCRCCGNHEFEFLDAERGESSTSLCGRNAVQVRPANASEVDLTKLAGRLEPFGEVTVNEYLLRLAVDDCEITVFKDARAIITGTDDPTVARSMYSRYVGN